MKHCDCQVLFAVLDMSWVLHNTCSFFPIHYEENLDVNIKWWTLATLYGITRLILALPETKFHHLSVVYIELEIKQLRKKLLSVTNQLSVAINLINPHMRSQ